MFKKISEELSFQNIDKRILEFWQKNNTFKKLVEKNRGNETFSFFDGPITANNPMGVHHAWGRTYKDIYQRYKAMKGYDQRYQNGFDCQGLWVEVEVEKELGLNSKREIEEYGLDKFSEQCRARVMKYSKIQTEQSIKLGQWMDWENSYYTMTDTNIEYIWYFLKKCSEKGWLYKGHRVMPWCIRCGTSLSQHEMLDSYYDVVHQSVYLRLPIIGRDKEYFMVWTTTPWTLTANVALAVNPNLEYVKVKQDDNYYVLSKGTVNCLVSNYEIIETIKGKVLEGLRYKGPFDEFEAQKGIEHKVILWDEVGETEGTGIVHIAPGCGEEDYQLSVKYDLPIVEPIAENGLYVKGFGGFTGEGVQFIAPKVFKSLKEKGYFYKIHDYKHRYPNCWRCGEELVFRLVDEWFISCDEIRPMMLKANEEVKWHPDFMKKRMDDWLNNMSDWCISRRRYWGLPLPFYPCQKCNKTIVVGSLRELKELAEPKFEKIRELHRPWIDEITIKCPDCGGILHRIKDVGDCWLDAGIISFSTLGYLDEDNSYWRKWFPADWISEMRAQLRCWFYSMMFMSVTFEGVSPYKEVLTYEKVLDEKGREMHKSWGNAIWFDDAVEKMGGDVIRWIYAGQITTSPLLFGYTPAKEVKRKFLQFWNVFNFFILYANIDKPKLQKDGFSTDHCTELDKWIISRLNTIVGKADFYMSRYDVCSVVRLIEGFFDDLANWYVRRNRRRFWKSAMDENKNAAYQTLYSVLINLLKVMAPIVPFITEEMYQVLVKDIFPDAPESIHLNDYPQKDEKLIDEKLEEDVALVKKLVTIALAVRNKAKYKVRQPLAELILKVSKKEEEAIRKFEDDIYDELNIKKITCTTNVSKYVRYTVKPDYKKLGSVYGAKLPEIEKIIKKLPAIDIVEYLAETGKFEVDLHTGEKVELTESDLIIDVEGVDGYVAAREGNYVAIFDVKLTDELIQEGMIRELVRHTQNLRKDAGFEVTDRLITHYNCDAFFSKAIEENAEYYKAETLTIKLIRITDDSKTAGPNSKEITINDHRIYIHLEKV